MRRGARFVTALVSLTLVIPFASVPVLGYDVVDNAPNCSSRERVAERLTGDPSNKRYFSRLTVWGVSPTIFQYDGPLVDIKVRRDYVVSQGTSLLFGSVLTQRREARLANFYVRCYDRLSVPYTYWPGKGCLDGVLGQSWRTVNQWLIYNLGGRSRSWTQLDFYTFHYKGPKVLFTAPLVSLVEPQELESEIVLTPGYLVHESEFHLQCYAGQELAGTLNYRP